MDEQHQQQTKKDLLELIPEDKLSKKQMAFQPAEDYERLPMYKMKREPTDLGEFDWEKYSEIVIWRKETLICISDLAYSRYEERNVVFLMINVGDRLLHGAIYGKSDARIAETCTFFWSLKHTSKRGDYTCLEISPFGYVYDRDFNFAAIRAEQLARILDSNPTRRLEIDNGVWSPEQAVVLANRPYPLDLKLIRFPDQKGYFDFKDKGKAFVDALEKRQSSFGELQLSCYTDNMSLSLDNLRRLFKLDIFEKLSCCIVDDDGVLLPMSANVKVLECAIDAQFFPPAAFDSLEIVTKDLTVIIYLDFVDNKTELLVSFFDRVATLGHFERLSLSLARREGSCCELIEGAPIAEALIRAVNANLHLNYLELDDLIVDWAPHLKNIFKCMEVHKGLRTFTVRDKPPDYSCLEQLLSKNRSITVYGNFGRKLSNGPSIDKIYSLNRMYHGSAQLVTEPKSVRTLLAATALVENASGNYQRTALLLSNHADALCECIHEEELDVSQSASGESSSPPSIPPESNQADPSKRKASIQPSRIEKKAARAEE